MMGWIIFLSVLLFFALLLIIPIRIRLVYEDGLELTLRYLFLKFRLVPAPEKKIDLNKFRPGVKKKKKCGAEKKPTAGEKKKRSENLSELLDLKGRPITETVEKVFGIVIYLAKKFFKALTVKIKKLCISVASGDAAKTAVMYGAVSQSLSYALNILCNISNLRIPENAELRSAPDFCGENSSFDADLIMSIRPVSLISLAVGGIIRIYINFMREKQTLVKENGGESNV